MQTFNEVILMGYMGKDAETFNNGKVVRISVATSRGVKKDDGTWENYDTWHRVVAWNEKYSDLKKGDYIRVDGRLATNKYQDKNGNDRYEVFVSAKKITKFDLIKKGNNTNTNINRVGEYEYVEEEEDENVQPF